MPPTTETGADRRLEAFRPVRVRSAADEVLAVLADAIRGGLYQPGDLLPRERDLAERLGVSRPVVREAIAVLRDAGIVTVRRGQGGGALVSSVANIGSVLRRIAGETRLEVRSVLEVRRAVELEAALLTAARATPEQLAWLAELAEALPAFSGRDQEFYEADIRFHLALGETSGNPMIAEIIRQTFTRITALREPFPHAHVDFEAAMRNQQEYMHAIRDRDPGGIAAAVDHHLGDFETVFLGEPLPATPGLPGGGR
jgi:GntR family transcriptional regulator, transcriptional repressor for pyruvate dehydrogenase complex